MWGLKYLHQTRFGTFVFRYTLPGWFQFRFPDSQKTIHLSLKTKDFRLAKIRLLSMQAYTERLLLQIHVNGMWAMGDRTVNQVLADYRRYIAQAEPWEQEDVDYPTAAFEEVIDYKRQQLITVNDEGMLHEVYDDLSNLDEIFPIAYRRHLHRKSLEAKERPKKQSSPTAAPATRSVPSPSTSEVERSVNETGVLLSQVFQAQCEHRYKDANPKTQQKMQSHIDFLVETVGDIPIDEFGQSDLRKYRQALDDRATHHSGSGGKLSAQTKNDHIASCGRLFRHAIGFFNSDITNYFANEAILFKVNKRDHKVRKPFTEAELIDIFSHDIFRRGKFRHPYHYWTPLLALLTGSRGNELAQLSDPTPLKWSIV